MKNASELIEFGVVLRTMSPKKDLVKLLQIELKTLRKELLVQKKDWMKLKKILNLKKVRICWMKSIVNNLKN